MMTNPISLRREMGLFGAVVTGLGSIVGTGVFVSIGIGAGVAGPSVVFAIVVAGFLATCNALSSAQLAASHPTSGGTYEYGYRYLHPWLGFSAGWLFLCAKSASAAAAATGFAAYLCHLIGITNSNIQVALAAGAVVLITVLVLAGMRRTQRVNAIVVFLTIASLLVFVAACIPPFVRSGFENFSPMFDGASRSGPFAVRFFEACALMFVAYTGYGRIATLGEEVEEPRKNIPRAIVITIACACLLYFLVGALAIGAAGATSFADAVNSDEAPLALVARSFSNPTIGFLISLGAITAMLGVLLNLLLGLSRVVLAMSRRQDVPVIFAKIDKSGSTPYMAVLLISGILLALVLFGNLKIAWSFSAFTVLCYYALTNLAALRLPSEFRLYPVVFSWLGLLGCLGLAFWVEPPFVIVGLLMLMVGLVFRLICQKFGAAQSSKPPVD